MGRNWHRRYTRRHLYGRHLHSSYDFRPWRKRYKKQILVVAIILAIAFFLYIIEVKTQSISKAYSSIKKEVSEYSKDKERNETLIEQRVLELVNEERQRYGARALVISERLDNLAKTHSEKMIKENFFQHSNYNVGENIGETPIHSSVIGCGSTYTNEAIAKCLVSGWIESAGHHQNMIDKAYSVTGIGVSCSSSKCRATQTFL